MNSIEEVNHLLSQFDVEDVAGRDVTSILTRLSEIFELEMQSFLKKDPDPFDVRHPSRIVPDCTFGHILKSVFRNGRIVDQLVKVYSLRHDVELNTAVCRFLLDILPGLEDVVFQEESFVTKLFEWAENASNPLQTFSTGLLAAAMDVPEIASSYREKNAHLVPLMLKRLKERSKNYLRLSYLDDDDPSPSSSFGVGESLPYSLLPEPESVLSKHSQRALKDIISKRRGLLFRFRYSPWKFEGKEKEDSIKIKSSPSLKAEPVKSVSEPVKENMNENSNSKWADYMFASYEVYPLTPAVEIRYMLQYLTPMGEYQELIGFVVEENALPLILRYIDFDENNDVRLAFEALKYLASLLCHKKIAIEFLYFGGLDRLLEVPRPSIAAAGVSFCFYYLGYIEEALEKIICTTSPSDTIEKLVSYALWFLECSHGSSRCHATLFFGFAFTYRVILEEFDRQDGLRKLFNVMSTLEIFVERNARTLNDDEILSNRLTTRQVSLALRRYFEAHLAIEVETKRSALASLKNDDISNLGFKEASKVESSTSEAVERNIEILHEFSLIPMFEWKPVNLFLNLDGVAFLLELIASYFELNYSGRAETVKNAIDILKICSLVVDVQLKFCEKISSPEAVHMTGISVLLQAAEGEMLPFPEVQRSALLTIINCVCSKVPSAEVIRISFYPKKKANRQIEDLLNKIWKAVRIKNGIIIIIKLLFIKTPLADADSIRAFACKALCGLSRSSNVKQIISKLPLVTGGQLIDLMKEPVLVDKYHEHVQFCKYGLELIERVTGSPLSAGSEYSMDLNKICVSEVVAKTKVVYQGHQLLHLIRDHLSEQGFDRTVQCLQQEMEEKSVKTKSSISLGAFPCRISKSEEENLSQTQKKCDGVSTMNSPTVPSIPPPYVPLRIVLSKKAKVPDIMNPPMRLQKPQTGSGSYIRSPAFSKMKPHQVNGIQKYQSSISLDSIVTEYLRKQHALCKNPMLVCPPFDLFVPHKCPEPHFKRNAPTNFVLRLQKQEICFKNGGYRGAALNRKHIYSRFRMLRSCRDEESESYFSTCAFFNNDTEPFSKILIGTNLGHIKLYNINTSKEILSQNCHFRGINHIESREFSPIFITSDGGRLGNSSLWNLSSEGINVVHHFSEVSHMEFAKRTLDKLIGTKINSAVIFDSTTFSEIQTFPVKDLGNNYVQNKATLDFSDELVLSDGLIYDIRSGVMLHKLDKFNSSMNGVFHPNGREIISNTEIWDIRTFKLLRTVSGLDQCVVTFNKPGTVIYAFSHKMSEQDLQDFNTTDKMCCFYTFDAHDYNAISTFDLKRPVYHLATDRNDHYVATVEGINGMECMCRIYEIGRVKEAGDENGDESEDSEEDDDEEDDDSDVEVEFEVNEGDDNENENDDNNDDEDLNWISGSENSSDVDEDDDDDVLFSLNEDNDS